jgi:hypothetical protein
LSEVLTASIEDRLWHSMRIDLAKYVPEVADNQLLMCCACGRFLRRECFDLEHLIPRQTLKTDPEIVRADPTTPANLRAGNLLLCKEPLIVKGTRLYNNGCNSWKGRFYDKPISDIFTGHAQQVIQGVQRSRVYNAHIIGALMLGYLAMVAEYGYIVALMESGRLLRQQFFRPNKFHPKLGSRYQVLLAGERFTSPSDGVWTAPFSFAFDRGACLVTARNFVITVPMSRDPLTPIARDLKFVPNRYKFRPDFRTVFD